MGVGVGIPVLPKSISTSQFSVGDLLVCELV